MEDSNLYNWIGRLACHSLRMHHLIGACVKGLIKQLKVKCYCERRWWCKAHH